MSAGEPPPPPLEPPPPPITAGTPALAQQLMRRVVVPLLVGFLLFLLPLVMLAVRDARSGLAQQAELRAAALALVARDVLGTGTPLVALEDLPRLPGEQVAVILPTGGQLQASASLPDAALSSPVIETALRGGIAAERLPELGAVVAAAPVVTGARVNGAAVTVLPSDDADARIRTVLLVLGLLSSGLLAIAVVAGRSLARTIVRPIATLDRVAGQLAAGDLDARAPTEVGPPELRRLAVTLNRSADRLQDVLAQQRRFVADASHQLRTPLTGLRLRLEAAEMAGGDPDGRLGAALAEVDRLAGLVGDLLLLARTEAQPGGGRPPELVDIDVVAVVEERVATWALLGQERDVSVEADTGTTRAVGAGPPVRPILAAVRPGALEQVLDNLLSNAVRVAPPGSRVEVRVRAASEAVRVTVEDRGPGMTAEQRARAFDRFWRAPDAAAGGSGLGLAIVRELVLASGGDVALHPREGGGLVAEVRLRPAGR